MVRNFEWIPDMTERFPEGMDLSRYLTVPEEKMFGTVYVPEDDDEEEEE